MDDIEFSSGMVGIAGTDPVLPIHHELRAAVRRRQSTPGQGYERDVPGVAPMSQLNLRNYVFNTMHQRMVKALVLNMAMVSQSFLSFLLPLKNASKAMWEQLLTGPLTLSDADLEKMFNLRKCTVHGQRNWQVGHVIFYIRSFSFEARQLGAVLDHLQSNGVWLGKAKRWRDDIKDLSPAASVFLRYCGCTGSSAWQRHHEDIFTWHRNSEFLHILHTTKLLYPEIIDEVNIYEFVTGTIPVSLPGSNEMRDLREQALIALLGLETLLNTQSGGRYPSTEPSSELEHEFSALRLSTLTRLSQQTDPCQPSVVQEIEKYNKNVQQYANDNPESTGTHACAFTDERCKALLPQLTPRTLKETSYAPMALVGHDPTLRDFQAGIPFYEGDSFFKESLYSLLRFLCRPEAGDQQSLPRKLFSQGYLPLFDFFPWNRKSPEDLSLVMTESRRYLQAINPLLLVTFGHQVSSVANGNFVHAHGLKTGDLRNVIGNPTLRYYCDANASQEVRDNSCVIIVPCYHPGAGLHGTWNGPEFVEVMTRTMIIAWTALFFALKLPKTGLTKYELLKLVIKATSQVVGVETSFATNFAAARDRLRASAERKRQATRPQPAPQRVPRSAVSTKIKDSDRLWGASVERRPYEQLNLGTGGDPAVLAKAERWDAARQEIEMIMLCGWASHPPRSLEANLQARSLVSKGVAALMTEKTGNTCASLWKWARDVDQGQYFYLEATDLADKALDLPNLLAIFAPTSANVDESNDWMDDDQSLYTASEALRQWLYQKVRKSTTTLENAVVHGQQALASLVFKKDPDLIVVQRYLMEREIRHAPKVYLDNTQSLEGCEVDVIPWVNVKQSATLKLQWTDNEGTKWQLTGHSRNNTEIVLPPQCMSTSRKDTRHIHFVNEGIDIRTADGVTLKSDGTECTLPLGHIRLMLNGDLRDKFLELWSRETGLSADDAEFDSRASRPSASARNITGQYYPAEVFSPPSSSRSNQELNVGSRGHQITVKSEETKIKKYLPLQAGDALWLLHKFLEEQYPGVCKLDAGNPNVIPGTDSVWTRLLSFVDTPKYAHHPMRQHLKDVATLALTPVNTAGCDQMLKLALEKFLRPGTSNKRARVYVAPKQKWKVVYDLSANPPSSTTLPASVDPQLQHDEILELVDDDNVVVGHDGELIEPDQETADDRVHEELLALIGDTGNEGTAGAATSRSPVIGAQVLRDTPMAGTTDDSSAQDKAHPSQVLLSTVPSATSYGTIQVPRTSSPDIPDAGLLKGKRARRTMESDGEDDEEEEGYEEEQWTTSKKPRL